MIKKLRNLEWFFFFCLLLSMNLVCFIHFAGIVKATTANFGYETIGAQGNQTIENYIQGSMFECLEDGLGISITAYIYGGGGYTGNVKAAIYRNLDLEFIMDTVEVVAPYNQGNWVVFTFNSQPSLIANGVYVLVVWAQSTTGTCVSPYDTGVATQGDHQLITYGDFPTLLDSTITDDKHSIYCTYTITTVPEYDYVDSQSNIDSVADAGTHSSFTAQKATDLTNDTLTEANTNTTKLNESENFVDNNSSDLDTHTGHGTSSNFTAQQDANVAFNDTLTEVNTASAPSNTTALNDGFEAGNFNNFDGNGATPWDICTVSTYGTTWKPHGGTYMAAADATDDGALTSDNLDMSTATAIYVSFWYMDDDVDTADYWYLNFYDGTAYDFILDLNAVASEDTWYQYNVKITDSQYFKSSFRIQFSVGSPDSGEVCFVDDVLIIREVTVPNNYELDYEFQWTTADYDEANEYLCIHIGDTLNAESLLVQVRDTTWKTVLTIASADVNSWKNVSLTGNLTSETITFRFLGNTETSDTTQSSWEIECVLIHVWSVGVNYELQIEEQFTSVNYTRTNEELCILMGSVSAGGETLLVQYWDGDSWEELIATLTTNVWNNISVSSYLTSATFTIRFKDGTVENDASQGTWDKDACLLHTWEGAGGDSTKPTYSSLSTNQTIWGLVCSFNITVNDETALHPNGQIVFGCNNTGTWQNEAAVNFTSTPNLKSFTKTLNSTNSNATSPEIIRFEFWFSDNAGNLNNTGLVSLTLYYPLAVGWNNVTIFSFDVGFTLAGINGSLNYDNINWTYAVYQNSSIEAQYSFVKGMSYNKLIKVYQETGILLIFCNEAGNWTHTYPYQGGDYGSDPTLVIVGLTIVSVGVALGYAWHRRRKKKKGS